MDYHHDTMLRSLGVFERALVLSDLHAPFNVVSVLRLESPPTLEIVQQVLRVLEGRHPLLRACIRGGAFQSRVDQTLSFETITMQNEKQWLEIVEREMNGRFDIENGLFRCVLIHDADRADLILTFYHAIVDGTSSANLLNELLRVCAALQADEVPHLPTLEVVPPVEERFPASYKGIRGFPKMIRYALAQMAEMFQYEWHVRGKRKPPVRLGGRGFALTLTISESLVDKLSKRCRAESVTLNSLLNAALLLAVNRQLYAGDTRLMQTFSFADLRPYTVPPISVEHVANYISMLRYTVNVSGSKTIWELTRDLHVKIHSSFKRGDKFLAAKVSESLMKMMIRMKSRRMGATALSYSGAVPIAAQYGAIQVKGLHGFISSFDLGPEVSAQVSLFKDELWMSFMFLETDMEREMARRIVGEVKVILEEAVSG